MNKTLLLIPIILSLMIIPITLEVHAEIIHVSTDKSLYHKGDTLTLSGIVSEPVFVDVIVIQIITPNDTFGDFNVIQVKSDNSFSYAFHVGDSTYWPVDGTYTIRVENSNTQEITIQYEAHSIPTMEERITALEKQVAKNTSLLDSIINSLKALLEIHFS